MTLIAIHATSAEVAEVERLKIFYQRKTNSDLLRFLIHEHAKKILSENVSIDTYSLTYPSPNPKEETNHAD